MSKTIKEVLTTFTTTYQDITSKKKSEAEQNYGWLNNKGRQLLFGFKSEIVQIKPWQCDLSIDAHNQYEKGHRADIRIFTILNHYEEERIEHDIKISFYCENEDMFYSIDGISKSIAFETITKEFLVNEIESRLATVLKSLTP